MREAIDYNALSWIRQEVGVTLKQARLELEEYAEGEQRKELLQGCAAHLHVARGPLQMVNIKGADMLACEMEEAIADLLLDTVVDKDTLLEQLMQGFLELPEYLSNLRTGKSENPRQLFPLINSLRASRGMQPLREDAVFSPDLSATMPESEFDTQARHLEIDVTVMARTARVRFQSGLLEWYRDSGTNHGLQMLVEVLEHLQASAQSEPAARIWWVAAGVAELLRDGAIATGPAVKRLFGQLDRQIKRLMDSGESVFNDILSEDLLKNLLSQLAGVATESQRVQLIRSTYGVAGQGTSGSGAAEDVVGIGEDLLQTVSATVRDDLDRIKERIDGMVRDQVSGTESYTAVADDLHSLGNTLGMIGMDRVGVRLSEEERQLRELGAEETASNDLDFSGLANTLVAVEDALSNIAMHSGNADVVDDRGDAVLKEGQQAVIGAVMADITAAKDTINEFLRTAGEFDLLDQVPVLLNKISGGLEIVGEERLALVARQVRSFIAAELLDKQRKLDDDELDSLADAICSIEYCVEELGENHRYGERAIGVATESLEKLGYSDAEHAVSAATDTLPPESATTEMPGPADSAEEQRDAEYQQESPVAEAEAEWHEQPTEQLETESVQDAAEDDHDIGKLQIVAPDADSEIVEIFIEEAGEVLDGLEVDIPAWVMNPEDRDLLGEVRRAFHTIKGSGRMIGAMVAGEVAWAFEDLLNRVIDGTIPANARVLDLVGHATPALRDLVAQVSNPDTVLLTDAGALVRQLAQLSQPDEHDADTTASAEVADTGSETPVQTEYSLSIEGDEPVLDGAVEEVREAEPDVSADQIVPAGTECDVDQVPEIAAALPEDAMDDMPAISGISDEDSVAVETVVHDAVTGSGACSPGDGGFGDQPVLKEDADQEIVEIFLEEAGEELESISLKIPEWIQQPEDTELLGDIRRSLHTLKGSGRMAGAMLAGEFAWSIEALLNKFIDGAVKSSGSLSGLMAQVPQAVSELLRQLQDGTVPEMDISVMMQKAAELANPGSETANEEVTESGSTEIAEMAEAPAARDEEEDDDAVLMELYSNECREHLGTLADSVVNVAEPVKVSDAQYRALHTLSGISESASVPGIGCIAAALYGYLGELYQEGSLMPPEATGVLADGVQEMYVQLQRLPDRSYDEDVVAGLLSRIDELPAVTSLPDSDVALPVEESGLPDEQNATDEIDVHAIPELPAAAMPEPAVVEHAEDEAGQEEALEYHGSVATEADMPGAADNAATPAEADIYSGMDQELYEIFVEEATEIIDGSEGVLRNWMETPEDHELMADFQRLLHTLKGGARMVDITAIGDLSHALESLLTQVADDVLPSNDDLFSLLQESHDRLAEMLEKVKMRAALEPAADLEARLVAFRRGEEQVSVDEGVAPEDTAAGQPEPDVSERAAESGSSLGAAAEVHGDNIDEPQGEDDRALHDLGEVESDTGLMVQAIAAQSPVVERRKESRARGELVRVQSDVLDNLVNNAGEINIYRARMEQQVSNFRFNLTELDQTISRLRDQLRQLEMETEAQILFRYEQEAENRNQEFDPLELDRYSKLQQLSRSLIESISDLRSLQGLMQATTRDSETLLLQQSRVSTDLQEGLIRTRMIPFSGLAPRLRRIVRQSARQLDKKVDLNLRGAEGEMDRAVIERIVAPLEHMLRNAVAHGIETPDCRRKAGKRVAGSITIDFSREGTEIVLNIRDDGAGLDIDAIRRRAIERGLMDPGMDLPDTDVMQFVLQTGFSTASEVTQIAGRGVGMDVVNSEVKQLGGSLHIDSEAGRGSVFTIRLPYTLAINQALLITVGEQIFCVPMSSVEGVVTAGTDQLVSCYRDSKQEFAYAGHDYQLMHLGSLLGISSMDLESAGTQVPVLLVRAGDKRIAVQVDSLLGSREVVIKPLGAQLSMVDGITGATILGDGRVVMILDMFAVSRMKVREQTAARLERSNEDGRLTVMVVDDSITVRKVTSRLLERSGYRVMTAKDGIDAMGQLQEVVPDMMLLDIEMPRMDGFELATHMRNDERLRHVPIIMITSRTGDKHRDRAFEIGVNEYLGKPYQESELLASINSIIGIDASAVGV